MDANDETFFETEAEKNSIIAKEIKDNNLKNNYVGLDIGTMNLVVAKYINSVVRTKHYRNVYLKVDNEHIKSMDLSNVSYAVIDDQTYFISESAYIHANVFGLELCRPMHKGMVSKNLDSIDVLAVMVKSLIGKNEDPDRKGICCYSIPANPIDDQNMDVIYHENVFSRIITELNYKPISLNEAVAIVYSECYDNNFTGIGISFGAGMTNIGVVFRSVPVLTFSLARGGDWIDYNAANSMGEVVSRVTSIKENPKFSLTDFSSLKKKEKRIKEALIYYYTSLINYTVDSIISQLSTLTIEFPNSIPVIVSGGTSMASGFNALLTQKFDKAELPFEISEIKSAKNPLTAVAEGCLIRSLKE